MSAVTPTDRVRVEATLAEMYRRPYLPDSAVIEKAAEQMGCCRRQIERAFNAFGASPARELRAIRTELAAACLLDPDSYAKTERIIAQRVGLSDDRALRRVMASRWGIAPSQLREAATLQRHIHWNESAKDRSRRNETLIGSPQDSHREHLRTRLAETLGQAPIEVRRLVEGELHLPLPTRAAEQAPKLAAERVARQWSNRVTDSELAA